MKIESDLERRGRRRQKIQSELEDAVDCRVLARLLEDLEEKIASLDEDRIKRY